MVSEAIFVARMFIAPFFANEVLHMKWYKDSWIQEKHHGVCEHRVQPAKFENYSPESVATAM